MLATSRPPEILFERHMAGQKIEQGRAHTQRRDGNRGNAAFRAFGEDYCPRIERKKIKPVDVEIRPFEKSGDVRGGNAFCMDL